MQAELEQTRQLSAERGTSRERWRERCETAMARAEAAEYQVRVSAARVLELETWIGNTRTTGILDYNSAEAVLKGSVIPR